MILSLAFHFQSLLSRYVQSCVKRSSMCMLRIMTSSPIVTRMNSAKPSQPRTMAATPTPLLTLPFPKLCATCEAATEAVCCQSTETSTNIDATNMSARATCDTGREGKYFISISDPVRGSLDSCQPGNVARMRNATNASMTATMLIGSVQIVGRAWSTHIR